MSGIPSTDLALLHDSIKSAIETEFPDLKEVSFYERAEKKFPTPSFRFEVEDIEPGQDTGGDQLDVVLHFSGYVIVNFREPMAKLAARVKAVNIAAFIRSNRFSSPVSGAALKGIEPDDFNTALGSLVEADEYEVIRIAWTHEAALGASVWDGEAETINRVFVGFVPEIGIPHEPDYIEVSAKEEETDFLFIDPDNFIFSDSDGVPIGTNEFALFSLKAELTDEDGYTLTDEDSHVLLAL